MLTKEPWRTDETIRYHKNKLALLTAAENFLRSIDLSPGVVAYILDATCYTTTSDGRLYGTDHWVNFFPDHTVETREVDDALKRVLAKTTEPLPQFLSKMKVALRTEYIELSDRLSKTTSERQRLDLRARLDVLAPLLPWTE